MDKGKDKKISLSKHLILHRTSEEVMRKGVPIITNGEGVHV